MKKITFYALSLALFLSFFGCQKDMEHNPPPEPVQHEEPLAGIKQGSIDDFREDVDFLDALKKVVSIRSKGIGTTNTLRKRPSFSIDSSKVVRVQRDSMTTYSILAKREGSPKGTVDNLILAVAKDSVVDSYILSYTPKGKGFVPVGEHGAYAFDGSLGITPINPGTFGSMAQKNTYIHITILLCDWEDNQHGSWHLAGPGCTPGYIREVNITLRYEVQQNTLTMGPYVTVNGEIVSGVGAGGTGGSSIPMLILDGDEDVYVQCEIILDTLEEYGLSPIEKNYLRNNLWLVQKLYPFLETEMFSPQAKAFAIEAIEAIEAAMAGGEVDFENHLDGYDFHAETTEILVFEQDYRNRMSNAEKAIFDNLSRFQQLDYLHSAYLAQTYATIYYDDTIKVQYNGKGDAYRHCLWNALATAKLGESITKQLTDAHEVPNLGQTNNPLEKAMDIHNNGIGRQIGKNSNFMLMMKVKFAVDNGDTKYISPTNLNGTIIPSVSQIISTDQ